MFELVIGLLLAVSFIFLLVWDDTNDLDIPKPKKKRKTKRNVKK